jgi:hypothetical protein
MPEIDALPSQAPRLPAIWPPVMAGEGQTHQQKNGRFVKHKTQQDKHGGDHAYFGSTSTLTAGQS